jgi:hypothetical protein
MENTKLERSLAWANVIICCRFEDYVNSVLSNQCSKASLHSSRRVVREIREGAYGSPSSLHYYP